MSAHNGGNLIADAPGFGRVVDCSCGHIHLSVGPVSVTLTHDGYMQLVALLTTSAGNFEYRLQGNSRESAG